MPAVTFSLLFVFSDCIGYQREEAKKHQEAQLLYTFCTLFDWIKLLRNQQSLQTWNQRSSIVFTLIVSVICPGGRNSYNNVKSQFVPFSL